MTEKILPEASAEDVIEAINGALLALGETKHVSVITAVGALTLLADVQRHSFVEDQLMGERVATLDVRIADLGDGEDSGGSGTLQ